MYAVLMEAVMPERTPMLMATHSPIFSSFLIWRFQIKTHGRRARTKSVKAE